MLRIFFFVFFNMEPNVSKQSFKTLLLLQRSFLQPNILQAPGAELHKSRVGSSKLKVFIVFFLPVFLFLFFRSFTWDAMGAQLLRFGNRFFLMVVPIKCDWGYL